MRNSLIANTRTDRELYLGYCLFTALHEQRERCFVTLSIENKFLPHHGAIVVFKDKRELFLLICTEVYFNVTPCLIDAFDFVTRRPKCRVQRVITSLHLKRNHAWLTIQSFR